MQQRRARGAAGGRAQSQRAAIAAQHGRKILCGGYCVPRGQQQARPIVQRCLSFRAEAIFVFVKVRVAQQRTAARYLLAGGQTRGDVPFDILRAPSCQLAGRSQRHARHAARALLAAVEHARNEQLRYPRAIKRHTADVLADIHNQNSYQHRILYYGPTSEKELLAIINKNHQAPKKLKEIPVGNEFPRLETPVTQIFIAPYEAKQIYMTQLSNRGDKFDPMIEPSRQMYNEYFGGGMNSIVFQEMRESRGLAYSAWAGLNRPSYLKYPYMLQTQIATQNDKMIDAIKVFNDIINNMPESEAAFKLAKEGLIARLRTERIIKSDIIWSYINAQDLGQNVDSRIKLYNDAQNMTLKDVTDFQKKWIKGRTYTYCILGDKKELDMEKLKEVGSIRELTQEEIFGY